MQKIIVLLGILLSITGASYAQQYQQNVNGISPDDRVFELPPYITRYKAWAQLGQGNSMRLELTSRDELARFQNIDSLLLVFFTDIKPLQDSLADPETAKRIDYLIDAQGHKKLRIRQTKLAASTYLVGDGEPALLKLQQDTVFLLIAVPAGVLSEAGGRASVTAGQRYDRLGFFLNRYEELNGLITTGLNRKIALMQTKQEQKKSDEANWTFERNRAYLKADPTISTRFFPSPGLKGELSLQYHVAIQNYKNYFTPSFSIGATAAIINKDTRNAFSVNWEPVFLFAHDADGRLQTYRNDFLVLGYSNRKAKPPGTKFSLGSPYQPQNALNLDLDFSIGYLIHSQGDGFVRHTFRLCVGSVNLAGNRIAIQPCVYFNDFLKGVTPGVRVAF
jgi:hypothetical protein